MLSFFNFPLRVFKIFGKISRLDNITNIKYYYYIIRIYYTSLILVSQDQHNFILYNIYISKNFDKGKRVSINLYRYSLVFSENG